MATKRSKQGKHGKAPRVGFIGVGLMGHGMAKNMLQNGYSLTVMGHRNRKPVNDLVRRGAKEAKTPAAVAKKADVVFLCVTSSVQVEEIVRGRAGIKSAARKGLTVVDCTTADPVSTLALAAELKPLGVRFVDAPLGRTPKEAEAGKLNTFVGADRKTFDELRPLFDTWAENVIHVGPPGNGHKIKLINNFIAMSYAAIFAEAFTAAEKSGVGAETLNAVVGAGPLASPFYKMLTGWILDRNPEAFKFTLANAAKDIRYFNRLAESLELAGGVSGAVKQMYDIALARGVGDRFVPKLADDFAELNRVTLDPAAKKTAA